MPTRVDHAERRRAIAGAALELAAREGTSAVTVGRVAEAAGVSKGAVQHWFPTKDELLRATATLLRDSVSARARTAVEASDGQSHPDVLRALLHGLLPVDDTARRDAAAGHAFVGVALSDPAVRTLVVEGQRLALAALSGLLAAPGTMTAQDTLPSRGGVDATPTARLLLATVGSLSDAVLLGDLDLARAAAELDTVLAWVRAGAGPGHGQVPPPDPHVSRG